MNVKLAMLLLFVGVILNAQKQTLSYLDIYEIAYVSNPQIAPDGKTIIYERRQYDIMTDKQTSNLWLMSTDATVHQKLTMLDGFESEAAWSNQGDRLAFEASVDGQRGIYVYWLNSQRLAKIAVPSSNPSSIRWSPDDKWLAFTMFVEDESPVIAKLPSAPKGATWADKPRITDRLKHEADGKGYIKPGNNQIFVVSTEGGSIRRITPDSYPIRGSLSWSADGKKIYYNGNRNADYEYQFHNSEIYSIDIQHHTIDTLTDRNGPDENPQVSPDGKWLAYLGYDDKVRAHQLNQIYLKNLASGAVKVLTEAFDRNPYNLQWSADSKSLYFMYDTEGNTKVGKMEVTGKLQTICSNVGGTMLGRPYASGSYSVSNNGTIAFTQTTPDYPAALAIAQGTSVKKLTDLNANLLPFRTLGKTESVWYKSSIDALPIQGWVVYPPNYNADKKYPLLVENHGGPILNYGDRFSMEMQLYAAAGYVVFYPNARGSTSYGEAFADKLFHNYPNEDAQDVMDGIDYLIEKGIVDSDKLFVTGGSAGGIMTAWLIGITNRFRAAVVAKPVVNWISKTLVADNYFYYADYRYPGQPWESVETYWKFSPISKVANIETPTMVMVGMDDLRTPPSEAKQLYHALKLRKKETVLVEIPNASHGIASRPSNLISKIAHTLAWFEKYH